MGIVKQNEYRTRIRAAGAFAIPFVLLAVTASAASGCLGPGDDAYSQVAAACMQPIPELGKTFASDTPTYLTPECRAALDPAGLALERGEPVTRHFLPYDEESFKNAPPGFRDKVNEAFQALIAYPIAAPAKNAIFGVAPERMGMIPLDITEIFADPAWSNPNQAIFNYVFNRLGVIRYAESLESGQQAEHVPTLSGSHDEMTLSHRFWNPDEYDADGVRMPFARASLLVHESRHAEGFAHIPCPDDSLGAPGGYACDAELNGPYGLEMAYDVYLLHGSAVCTPTHRGLGCAPPLTPLAVRYVGAEICNLLQNHFKNLDPALAAVVKDKVCEELGYDTIMSLEGL